MKKLIEIRNKKKKQNPRFVRTDAKWKLRLPLSWRKPRGLHNKIRLQKKGYNPKVKAGYRTPAAVRNLTNDGKQRVMVRNLADLKSLNKDSHAAIIAATVGKRKRQLLLEEAKKLGVQVKGVKDVSTALDKIKQGLTARKAKRKDLLAKRSNSAKKEKKKEKKKEAKSDDAAKAEEEKKEKQKTLTKRL